MTCKTLVVAMAAALAALAQQPAESGAPAKSSAVDKVALEAYLRHLFVWPPSIDLKISDPEPGPMAGFNTVKIRATKGNQSQDETFYVSQDGRKMVRGQVYDTGQNPFRRELEKIDTQMQPSFGTPGAPVVIAEFSDFQCPYCREEARALRENVLKTFPKEVRVYYFDYPLEQIHPWAKPAAIAGRCVFRQNAATYWQFHDWLFDVQKDITPDNLKSRVMEFAKGKDVDAAQLSACIDDKATEAEVNRTMLMGKSLSISQTPTIFVNGRRVPGAVPWGDLKFIIDYEIGYQKTAKNAGEDCGCDLGLPKQPGAPGPEKPLK